MIKTTREVAQSLEVNPKTLQLWVREGFITPRTTGEGRQRRIEWSEVDVLRAQRLRDRNGTTPVVAAFNPELASALVEVWRLRDYRGENDVAVAGEGKGRIFRLDAPLSEVLSRVKGPFLLLAR